MTLDHANQMIAQFLHDAQQPDYPHLVDMADVCDEGPTELQILDAVVEAFDLPRDELIERLIFANFMALREEAVL